MTGEMILTIHFIHVYGRWGTINSDGSVTFAAHDHRITTTSFPPVFAGTLGAPYTNDGYYDPVYPPGGVNLHWHWSQWPSPDPLFPQDNLTSDAYKGHIRAYNGVWADGPYVYVSWTDSRLHSLGTLYPRNQSDIRFVRVTWPQ